MSEGVIRVVLDLDEHQLSTHQQTIYRYEILNNWSASAEYEVGGLARTYLHIINCSVIGKCLVFASYILAVPF